MTVMEQLPMTNCGPTSPVEPFQVFCTRHHQIKFGREYTSEEWEGFFDLDTSKCTPVASAEENLDNLAAFMHVLPHFNEHNPKKEEGMYRLEDFTQ
jgi:hypothetical protein